MSKKHETGEHAHSQQHPPPPVNVGDTETNPSIQKAKASRNTTNNSAHKQSVYKGGIAFITNKDNQPFIANLVSFGMLIATVVLAIYTYKVFNQATTQSKAAIKADSIAQGALDTSRKYSNISANIQKRSLDSQISAKAQSDIADERKLGRDTLFINKQKQGIDSQISAIKQTQKQFEISHSPYINVIGFGRNPADSLEIDIQNQGTQVAYLVEFDYAVKAEIGDAIYKKHKTIDDWNNWLIIHKNPYNTQSIIAPGIEAGLKIFKTLKSVSDMDMNLVQKRKKILFIRVMIYYFNTTTNRYMRYDYIAGWNPVDNLLGTVHFGYTVIKKYPE